MTIKVAYKTNNKNMTKIYKKKESVGSFLKKGEDIKDGDIITIANEGKEQEGEYGVQNIFLVKLKDGREGNVGFNQTTINGLVDAFGENALEWVGKEVKVLKVKQNVSGKFRDVYYFAHLDAELTEDGIVMPGVEKSIDNIPVIDEDDINVNEIPF